jgi:YidC/Oxa1 family membrane protein insertase
MQRSPCCAGLSLPVSPPQSTLKSCGTKLRRLRRCHAYVGQLEAQSIQDIVQNAGVYEQLLRHHHELSLMSLSTLMDLADAAGTAASSVAEDAPDNGWLAPLVDGLEGTLRFIRGGLDAYKVPYSYGWSIVALTLFVKTLTFPLTKIQVEATMSQQKLKPEIDLIKEKYGEDKDAISRETSALYEKADINPLAGCLPTLATIPIFIGLYRSFSSVASQGELDNQGFYWIPSLAGPTSVAAQRAGDGTAWLLPFVDGHPPIGWGLASAYLVLPVALLIAQYVSSAIITPPIDPNAENANVQKGLYLGLPLMIFWFSLNLPSGLSLYYFTNTVLTSAQQIWLRKLGGARLAEYDLGEVGLGQARRSGVVASSSDGEAADGLLAEAPALESSMDGADRVGSGDAVDAMGAVAGVDGGAQAASAPVALRALDRRCKRKKEDMAI